MAGHLPVKQTPFRMQLLTEAKNVLEEWKTDDFYKVDLEKFPKYKAMRLPLEDYNMNDEHGEVDHEIIAVSREEDTLEFHLDENGKLNEIYLVM